MQGMAEDKVSSLKNRHLQLMALGGAIGAGFFLGSGTAISQAGPALLIAYLLAGAMIYLVMRALGELTFAYPSRGSFADYTARSSAPSPVSSRVGSAGW